MVKIIITYYKFILVLCCVVCVLSELSALRLNYSDILLKYENTYNSRLHEDEIIMQPQSSIQKVHVKDLDSSESSEEETNSKNSKIDKLLETASDTYKAMYKTHNKYSQSYRETIIVNNKSISNVRWDCSGYVSAVMCALGYDFRSIPASISMTGVFNKIDDFDVISTSTNGFQWKRGDVMIAPGHHVQIFVGKDKDNYKILSFGGDKGITNTANYDFKYNLVSEISNHNYTYCARLKE